MMKPGAIALSLLACLPLLAGGAAGSRVSRQPLPPGAQPVRERVDRLGPWHEENLLTQVSGDGLCVVQIVEEEGRQRLVADGVPGPVFDEWHEDGFRWSQNGHRYALLVRSGASWRILSDGRDGPECDSVGFPLISADGAHLAYRARRGDMWCVVMDDRLLESYPVVHALTLSDRGGHLAYAAGDSAAERVVVDGRPGPLFDDITHLALSGDGGRCAYVAASDDRACAVIDGVQGPMFHKIAPYTPVFSPDGAHTIYVGIDAYDQVVVVDNVPGTRRQINGRGQCPIFSDTGGHYVYPEKTWQGERLVHDGVAGQAWGKILPGEPFVVGDSDVPSMATVLHVPGVVFSDDGVHMAYAVESKGRQLVVVDGRPGAAHERLVPGSLLFSSGGRRFAYVMADSSGEHVVLDGVAGPACDGVRKLDFSHDGERFGYVSSAQDRQTLMIDGVPGPAFDELAWWSFSPDGCQTACAGQRGEDVWMVLNEQESGPHEGAGQPLFSPDSRHFAFPVSRKGRLHFLLDGSPGRDWEHILAGGPIFREDGTLEYLATDGGSLYRVRMQPDGGEGEH